MNYKFLLAGAFMFLIAQIITWFQLNSQFIWKWSRDNEWAMALIGIPLSLQIVVKVAEGSSTGMYVVNSSSTFVNLLMLIPPEGCKSSILDMV